MVPVRLELTPTFLGTNYSELEWNRFCCGKKFGNLWLYTLRGKSMATKNDGYRQHRPLVRWLVSGLPCKESYDTDTA